MEREELLKEWGHKIVDQVGDDAIGEVEYGHILDILESVFEVGRQTGIDEEKTRVQLEQLGKPAGV